MKKGILAMVFMAAGFAATAGAVETNMSDTVVVERDVTVVETACADNNVSYRYGEGEFNFTFPFTRHMDRRKTKRFKHWEATTGVIGLGWNSTIDQTAGLKQRGSHSVDFFWGNIVGVQYRAARMTPAVTLGVGIDFRNWNSRDGVYDRADKDSKSVACLQAPEGASNVSSRLYAFSMMFPLTIRQSLTHGFSLTLGASLDVTTHASVHSSWYANDVKYSRSWDGMDHNVLGWSALGALQWNDLGVFVRYTPTSPVKKSDGIDFKTLTVGIAVGW